MNQTRSRLLKNYSLSALALAFIFNSVILLFFNFHSFLILSLLSSAKESIFVVVLQAFSTFSLGRLLSLLRSADFLSSLIQQTVFLSHLVVYLDFIHHRT